MPVKTVAIYARVSTRDQNLENQLIQLRRYALESNWTINPEHEYIEKATGGTMQRPALSQMLQAAHRREFQTLLFWRLDRITRTGIKDTLEILEQLHSAGVGFHSYMEPHLQTSGSMGTLMIAMLATFAEIEREANRDRTRAGLERARKAGKQIGR